MGNIPRPPIYRIPLAQLAILLPFSGAMWFYNATASYSLFLGGLIHLIPNAYFATRAFRYQGVKSMQQTMGELAKGEILKFLMSAIGFALVFAYFKPINIAAIFCAYIAMTFVHAAATAKYLIK